MIQWETLRGWEVDWLTVSADAIRNRQAFLSHISRRGNNRLSRALLDVLVGRRHLVRDYAYEFGDELAIDSAVATATRLRHLLETAQQYTHTASVHPHTWFDAVATFDQAIGVAKIEQEASRASFDDSVRVLIEFLLPRVFEPELEFVEFYAYHDPVCEYTVGHDDLGINRHLSHRAEGKTRKKHTLQCRRVKDNGLVFLDHRVKDAFSTWLKIQRKLMQGVDDPYVVHDRCGLIFVVEQSENVPTLARQIQKLLEQDGGTITEPLACNLQHDGAVDCTNKDSTSAYKIAKMCVVWRSRRFELQFSTFYNYFSSQTSLSLANHELYRLRQARRYFFPLLYPDAIYGVRWENPRIIHALETQLKGKLTSRFNGHES